jgi:hypothetical protein
MRARLLAADGAGYRMTLGYEDGRADTFDSTFVECVPNELVVERICFDAPERAGEMTVTTTLRDVGTGVEVSMRFEGLPATIKPRDNQEGARQALVRLARLLEFGLSEEIFDVNLFRPMALRAAIRLCEPASRLNSDQIRNSASGRDRWISHSPQKSRNSLTKSARS